MEAMYSWVKNIAFYLIFMTVLGNMLPDKKYEKYIKLFAGMVLILLVLKPITAGLHLDDKLAYSFGSITFQKETDDLKKQLTGMESERLSGMIGQYEDAIAMDLERMAQAEGFYKKSISVTIEPEQGEESFGKVTGIAMVLTTKEPEGEAMQSNIMEVEPVTPVVIESEQNDARENREVRNKENTAVNTLRTRITEYYGLEAQAIEIQLEAE